MGRIYAAKKSMPGPFPNALHVYLPASWLTGTPAFRCSAQSLAVNVTLHTTPASPSDVLPSPHPTAGASLLPGFLPRPPRCSPRFCFHSVSSPSPSQMALLNPESDQVMGAALSYGSRSGSHGLLSPSPGSLPSCCTHGLSCCSSSSPHARPRASLTSFRLCSGRPSSTISQSCSPHLAGCFIISLITSFHTILFTC